MIDPNNPPVLFDWIQEDVLLEILHCTKRTLELWRERKKIPFTRMGKFTYYLRQDIEQILIENYVPNDSSNFNKTRKSRKSCKKQDPTTGATPKTTAQK